jgi:hypothetical protein
MGKIAKQIAELKKLCTHPKIVGTGQNEGPWGYDSVTWKCDECGSHISENTVLKKGTVICFWSTAKLKRTCKLSEIRDSDQEIIS